MSATPEGKSAQTDDSSSDIVSAEKTEEECVDQAEINKKNYNPIYAFFVLFVVLICRIVVQWHRKGLTYAYGYTGLGEAANNGFYEMATYFPELKIWYGLLAGVIYTIPYAGFGLIAGKLSDGADRRLWLGIVVLLASLTMGASYFTGSFAVLACMRIIHGCLNSASNPLSFSLIADYFPPDKRSTANSII
jgi:MFS family permease